MAKGAGPVPNYQAEIPFSLESRHNFSNQPFDHVSSGCEGLILIRDQ
jgi:hypothetical protein